MKTAWLSHTAEIGGAELAMVEAVRALDGAGVRSAVVLPREGPLREPLERAGAEVVLFPTEWWMVNGPNPLPSRVKRWTLNLARLPGLRALLLRLAPDVVVSNTIASPAGALAARVALLPHVWYIHEFGREDHDLRWDLGEATGARLIAALSRRVLVNSDAVAGKFGRWIPAAKLRRVYYAVELPPAWEPPKARPGEGPRTVRRRGADGGELAAEREGLEFRLVLVGFRTPGKRQEDAIRALALLRAAGVPARLELIGRDAPGYGELLRRLSEELEVSDFVDFISFTPDPLTPVAGADVALICSASEAFGRVTVEAMKVGRPVVGADSGGTRELIRDGWNGLLYRPGEPEDLALKLERLYQDPASRREMGGNALNWAWENFSRERYAEALLPVLREAAGPP